MEPLRVEGLEGRDLLSLADLSKDEFAGLLTSAVQLKQNWAAGVRPAYLQHRSLALVFEKPSLRTRTTFDLAMYQLGGHALFLSPRDIQLGRGESIKDTAQVLARMLDGIMIRTFEHEEVLELAKWADIPIINGLTDLLHPTQIIGDMMTIKEHKGTLKGLKCVFIGDGNNVAHSLLFGGAKVGMDIIIACPPGFEPSAEILTLARQDAQQTGAKLSVMTDPQEAVRDADIIYTDVWASMGQEDEAEEKEAQFLRYQVNQQLMSLAKKDAIVLHCLPAKRGKEITDEVMDGPQSVVFDEAENRLHAHKAIMALVM